MCVLWHFATIIVWNIIQNIWSFFIWCHSVFSFAVVLSSFKHLVDLSIPCSAFWRSTCSLSNKFMQKWPFHAWSLLNYKIENSRDFCAAVSLGIHCTWPKIDHHSCFALFDSGMVLHILNRALLEIKLFGHQHPVVVIWCLQWQVSSLFRAAFGTVLLLQWFIIKDTHVVQRKSKVFYNLAFGGTCGVIVIVVGNEHGDTSSNPGRNSLHFT